MASSAPHPEPSPTTINAGHEPDRFRTRWLWIFLATLVVAAILIHLAMWLLLQRQATRVGQGDASGSSAAPRMGPPLQPSQAHDLTPRQDRAALYERENRLFRAMGWRVDERTHQASPPESIVERVVDAARSRAVSTTRASGRPASQATPLVTPIPRIDQGGSR